MERLVFALKEGQTGEACASKFARILEPFGGDVTFVNGAILVEIPGNRSMRIESIYDERMGGNRPLGVYLDDARDHTPLEGINGTSTLYDFTLSYVRRWGWSLKEELAA